MSPLILLASFPKSGNTWLRILLSNLLYADEAPISINDIRVGGFQCDKRELFDQLAPWDASDLTLAQIDCLLPDFYRQALDQHSGGPVYLKTHDLLRKNADGEWVFPAERVTAAIQIVRHPLDVLPSYAQHFGLDHASALQRLLAPEPSTGPQQQDKRRLPERHGSWLEHTLSWQAADLPFPVHFARYEDLRARPVEEFGRLLQAIGLTFSEAELNTALHHSSFSALQQQENRQGFRERYQQSTGAFFRKGQVGSGRQEVAPALQQQLQTALQDWLPRWGYQ